jgi:hypothetical protein
MRQLPIHTSSSGRLGLFENRCTSDERHHAVNQLDGKKEEHPLEFARLAHSFEKLEQTSSRLALIAILAELFRSIERPYALRFPRLVTFREQDKRPEDARTVEELIEMYQRQGKK